MHKPMLPKDAVFNNIFFRSTWKFWPYKLNLFNPIQIQVNIDEIKKFQRTICILKQLQIKQHDHGPLHGVTQCRPKAIISKKCRKLTWKENTNCMSFSFHAVNENYSQIHRTLLVPLTSSLTTYRKCSFSLFILTENLINNSGIILCWIAISGANTSLFTSHCVGRFNKAQPGRCVLLTSSKLCRRMSPTMTCHHFGLWFAYIKLLIVISSKVSVNVKWICSSYLVKINFEPSVGSSLEFVMLRNTCFTSIESIQLNRVFEDDEMKVNLCDPSK